MSRVLLLMIDGVSADYLRRHRANLPHLAALAEEGVSVERLASDVPGTSLPGRTSIVTGVGADRHGIHGNVIWDGAAFRYANADDVRVPTLPRRARDAGLDVASIGYGMVRPEDASVYRGAWWVGEMLQRSRDEEPVPADEGWLRTARHEDPTGRLAALADAGLPEGLPDPYVGDGLHYLLSEVAGDRAMMRWTAGLLASDTPPDLTLSEILVTDTVQHQAGPDHPFTHWAVGYADALVGTLIFELKRAGRFEDTTLVITSDHGHGAVTRALYAERLLPGWTVAPEGSLLFVAADGERDAQHAQAVLREHGVERLDGAYLPPDVRGSVVAFVAPEGATFQARPAPGTEVGDAAVSGPAKYVSSHGFRPGHPFDERFLIARGPGLEARTVARAEAADVEATVAALAGLPPLGAGRSLA